MKSKNFSTVTELTNKIKDLLDRGNPWRLTPKGPYGRLTNEEKDLLEKYEAGKEMTK